MEGAPALRNKPTERIQRPAIRTFIVAKDVEIAVVSTNLKALVTRSVPLVQDLFHLKSGSLLSTRPEADRALVGLVSGVTLDMEFESQGGRTILCLDDQFPVDGPGQIIRERNRPEVNPAFLQDVLR